MNREQIERLRHEGPLDFEGAVAVRQQFAIAASNCLIATDDRELGRWMSELRAWLSLLPWAAAHVRYEIERKRYEMPTTILVELPPK